MTPQDLISAEIEGMKKEKKKIYAALGLAALVLIVTGATVWDLKPELTGYATLETIEGAHVKMSSAENSLYFNEISDFKAKVGDRVRIEIEPNKMDGVLFTDDTRLFDINSEGVIEFTPEEKDIGQHRVVVIMKNLAGQYYMQDLHIVIEE